MPEFKAELSKNIRHNFGEPPEYLQILKKELYKINKCSSHLPMIQSQIEAFESLSHIIHQLHALAESIRRNLPKHRTLKAYINYYNLEILGVLSLTIGAGINIFILKNIILEIIEAFKKNNKIVETNTYKNLESYLKIDNHSTISSTLESIKVLIKSFIAHRNAIYFGDENVFSIYTKSRYNFFFPPIVFIEQEHQTNLDKYRNTK